MIGASVLSRRIVLQQRSVAQNTAGEPSNAWTPVATVWANVTPLNAHELMAAEAVQSSVSHQITIRYQAQFADPAAMAKMRATLTKDGVTRYFNIHGARDDGEMRQNIILDAEEGLNDG